MVTQCENVTKNLHKKKRGYLAPLISLIRLSHSVRFASPQSAPSGVKNDPIIYCISYRNSLYVSHSAAILLKHESLLIHSATFHVVQSAHPLYSVGMSERLKLDCAIAIAVFNASLVYMNYSKRGVYSNPPFIKKTLNC